MELNREMVSENHHLESKGVAESPIGEIVCRSEREVFEAVGLPYREPWERD